MPVGRQLVGWGGSRRADPRNQKNTRRTNARRALEEPVTGAGLLASALSWAGYNLQGNASQERALLASQGTTHKLGRLARWGPARARVVDGEPFPLQLNTIHVTSGRPHWVSRRLRSASSVDWLPFSFTGFWLLRELIVHLYRHSSSWNEHLSWNDIW